MIPKKRLLLTVVILIASFFRLQNLNWDSNFHLHPDERFLTMVGVAMKLPGTFSEYIDPAISPMNPANIGYGFFVYGTFPVVATKLLALIALADNYNAFTVLGRLITALLDILILVFIYRSVRIFEEEHIVSSKVKYWATFLYAIAVLPIQYAHFFTTDTFLNFFMFGAFYFALSSRKNQMAATVLSGLFLALAAASKINALLIVPLVLFLLLYRPLAKKSFLESLNIIIIFLAVSYMVLRITAPYYFQNPDPFDLTPNRLFMQNLTTLKSFEGRQVMYPPALQWVNTVPLVFPFLNMALFGFGFPEFLLVLAGVVPLTAFLIKHRKQEGWLVLAVFGWVAAVFVYQSVQFVKVMRYFLFLYPFLSILGGWGAVWSLGHLKKLNHRAAVAVIGITLIWPLVFSSIYFFPNTRVEATGWIYRSIPDDSLILSEYWDDALPIGAMFPAPRTYRGDQLAVFDPDTGDKWKKITNQLKSADYYILSSNRGWGTLPSIPERFPESTAFYNRLFSGKAGYSLVKSFYPVYYPCRIFSFTCPRLLSNWFDESFTVYDHPTVYIFKNNEKRH